MARMIETYGDQVRDTVRWARLPAFLERNGCGENVWTLVEDLGVRETYPMLDLLLWMGF